MIPALRFRQPAQCVQPQYRYRSTENVFPSVFRPSREVMLADSSTTRICTGASLANLFIPKPAAALPTFSANDGSVTTTNLQAGIAGRRCQPSRFKDAFQLIRLHKTRFIVSPVTFAGHLPIAESRSYFFHLYSPVHLICTGSSG